MRTPSSELEPGTRLRHVPSGTIVVLDRRKQESDDRHGLPFHPGWWLKASRGGLADFVIDDPDGNWVVADQSLVQVERDAATFEPVYALSSKGRRGRNGDPMSAQSPLKITGITQTAGMVEVPGPNGFLTTQQHDGNVTVVLHTKWGDGLGSAHVREVNVAVGGDETHRQLATYLAAGRALIAAAEAQWAVKEPND